ASLKSLRRSVLRIASCSCLLRPKISCAIGLTHICTRSQNENDDLSATELRQYPAALRPYRLRRSFPVDAVAFSAFSLAACAVWQSAWAVSTRPSAPLGSFCASSSRACLSPASALSSAPFAAATSILLALVALRLRTAWRA